MLTIRMLHGAVDWLNVANGISSTVETKHFTIGWHPYS